MKKLFLYLLFLCWFSGFAQIEFEVHQPTIDDLGPAFSLFTAVDMDNDGDMDFAWADYRNDLWIENEGNNIFSVRQIIGFPEPVAGSSTDRFLVDFDGDGDMDFINSTLAATHFLENTGNNIFVLHLLEGVGFMYVGQKPLDFDSDGDLDLFSYGKWYRNDGNMIFTEQSLSGVTIMKTEDMADYNNDGFLDNTSFYVNYSLNNSVLKVMENQNNNTFIEHDIDSYSGYTSTPIKHIIDFDFDGDKDIFLVLKYGGDDKAYWYENTGNFNFVKHVIPNLETTNGFVYVYLQDINNDKKMDILWQGSTFNNGYYFWFENIGSDSFIKHSFSTVNSGYDYDFNYGDLNHDGYVDVVIGRSYYLNHGNGNFSKYVLGGYYFYGIPNLENTSLADMDGDGDLDVSDIGDSLIWFENNLDPITKEDPIGKCYNEYEELNWISNCSFDLRGRLTSSGVSYFNEIGKATQSQTVDIKTGRIWASQTMYDFNDRAAFQSLSAPVDMLNFGYKNFVLKANGSTLTTADVESITEDNANLPVFNDQEGALGWYYSENNNREPYQDITANPYSKTVYSELNPGTTLKTLGGNKITVNGENKWLNGYSFTMPVAQELFYAFGKDKFPVRDDLNAGMGFTGNAFCTITSVNDPNSTLNVKVSNGNYTTLIPNKVYEFILSDSGLSGFYVLNFFEYEDDYIQSIIDNCSEYPYTGDPHECPDQMILDSKNSNYTISGQVYGVSGVPYYIKATKAVSRDVHGVETVVFTDADGNTLAAARSGNEDNADLPQYPVVSTIGEQGFVDIHIPVGCGGPIQFEGDTNAQFRIYDLITENIVGNNNLDINDHPVLSPGFYRVEKTSLPKTESYVNINSSSDIQLINPDVASGIRYNVNYYDYSLNYYDKAGRLTSSVQPKGFDNVNLLNKTFVTPNHSHVSTFSYNTLGQLEQSASPDEGSAHFLYRKDGQIRYSQNSKQVDPNDDGQFDDQEYSYTNYDDLGRPVESGVLLGTDFNTLDPDESEVLTQCSELRYPILFGISDGTELWIETITNDYDLFDFYELLTGSNTISYDFPFLIIYEDDSQVTITDKTQFINILGQSINGSCYDKYTLYNKKSEINTTMYDITEKAGLKAAFEKSGNSSVLFNYLQHFVAGNVSMTQTRRPRTTTTWYSYDVYGRVEWIVQEIDGLGVKTIDYEYDQTTGEVTKVFFQKYFPSELFVHKYKYNIAGQLDEVSTSTDNSNFITQANYEYYETGALKRTILANGLQGIDYVYNLAGQLKAINSPNLGAQDPSVFLDPGNDGINGTLQDVFGMTLDYYSTDYLRNAPSNLTAVTGGADQFNGNIKATAWQTQTLQGPSAYYYNYNKNNWLTDAGFTSYDQLAAAAKAVEEVAEEIPVPKIVVALESILLKPGFSTAPGIEFVAKITQAPVVEPSPAKDYDVTGITYDANGNILTLNRNKNTENGTNEMDELIYDIKTNNNQLDHVVDTAPQDTGVEDIKTQHEGNYKYNKIGQLVEDWEDVTEQEWDNYMQNGTVPANIIKYSYNATGLVREVQKNNVPLVKFFYNDKGYRVRKESYSGGVLVETTFYVCDVAGTIRAIYKDNSLVEIPVYGDERLGIYFTPASGEPEGGYVYQLTDHLGNVRSVIASGTNGTAIAISRATDYYPFGMPMPYRNIDNGNYRYAYQGQEKDPETGKEAFELRLWDGRLGRWLTTDPKKQFASPYLGMGNNPVSTTDPDGGSVNTDYKNKKTGETVYVNDGANQVIEIDDKYWDQAVYLSKNYDKTSFIHNFINNTLIKNGKPRPDLFFTIRDVLEDVPVVTFKQAGNNCHTASNRQEQLNGGHPGDRYERIDLWTYNQPELKVNVPLAEKTITRILLSGHSVVTGVNYAHKPVDNYNLLTIHFVNIVGQGNDKHGNYYIYRDNVAGRGFKHIDNENNRFRPWNEGWVDHSTWSGKFRITEIRLNK